MERAKTITIIILLLGLLLSIGYTFYLHKNSEPPEVIYVAHTDTLTLTDTIINQHTQIRYITTHDTLITYVHDSITDTIHFEIPIEHKTYRDTITNDSTTYDIHIDYSGYNSNIDRLEIKTQWLKEVTIPLKKPRKFHISLLAGYYTGYNLVDKRLYSGPGAGIGISYDLW